MTTFDSVYEMTNPLTEIRRQHFWEYFSGSTLNSRWNVTQVYLGGGTAPMSDSVDGGCVLTTAGGSDDGVEINFQNHRAYNPTGSVIIGSIKKGEINSYIDFGFSGTIDGSNYNSAEVRMMNSGNFRLITGSSGGSSTTHSDLAIDLNWHTHKIECSITDTKLTIGGVLKIIKTTDRPNKKAQPAMSTWSLTDASAKHGYINYCEAYNT
tara:strand:- start:12 stop:638 length:627 start_codon:yes stop_codon:yes gene_type:complete